MNTYLIVKWVHVVSSVVLVGTGFGTAYYLFFANRTRNVAAIAVVARLVVRADTWFTLPAAIIQPTTGFYLATAIGLPLTTPWLAVSVALFAFAAACWVVAVRLQLRMARIATAAANGAGDVPPDYWRIARAWELLGYPAFIAMLVVFYLMVARPGAA